MLATRHTAACSRAEGPQSVPEDGEIVPKNTWLWVSRDVAREAVWHVLHDTHPARAREFKLEIPSISLCVLKQDKSLFGPPEVAAQAGQVIGRAIAAV